MFSIVSIFLLTGIFGAAVGALVKFLLTHLDPLSVVAIRFFIGFLIVLPFTFRIDLVKKIFASKIVIISSLFFSLNVIFYAIGIQHTSLIMGQLLYVLTPLIVAVIAYIFLKEKLTKNQIVGLLISLIGIAILTFGSLKTADIFSFGKPLGNSIIAMAVISWSLYTVFSRKVSQKLSAKEITFSNFLTAAAISFVGIGPLISNRVVGYSLDVGVNLIALALAIIGLLFIVVYQLLIKKTSAFIASLNLYIQVIWSTLLGIILFSEKLQPGLIFGGILIILGVFLATTYGEMKNKIKIWTFQ